MDAATLSKAMGGQLTLAQYKKLLPDFENAMRAANITTVNRAAMWCAQIGHESLGLRYMEEIASGAAYEWRKDLGNTRAGDGKRFKGSGPIQLTGRYNFTKFSKWCYSKNYTTSSTTFVNSPHLVRTNPKWGFLAASWYWTAERPNLNAQSDSRSLEAATRSINGGLNGLADRRARYNRCLNLGTKLLPSKGASATPAKKVVVSKPKLAVDGKFGPATKRALQSFLKVSADGIYGPATKRALQKWVGTKQDGIVGPATIKALQKKVSAKPVDGIWGAGTTRALQTFLNKK